MGILTNMAVLIVDRPQLLWKLPGQGLDSNRGVSRL